MAFFNRKKKDEEIESQSCGCQRPNTGCRPCPSGPAGATGATGAVIYAQLYFGESKGLINRLIK
ncbi:MAG TPA: hypothetical protein IAB71_02155 [Candidatus Scatomonas pullistercoris]|uniref:Uncharacterized protein n=1 Tax=Candidatus Scatomonas pullistercoris TaxID=2840920 RepID=A0A9D1TAD9_9FIRM|nr:hypothetical protein [Candidatus Scatomonas pullistercoris]